MVLSAAELHRQFVDRAKARRSLASVENSGAGAGDSINKVARQRCDSRHATEKVQRRSFSRKQRSRVAAHFGEYGVFCNARSIFDFRLERDPLTKCSKHFVCDTQPGNDAFLFCDDAAVQRRADRHDAVGRYIASTYVFLQRTFYAMGNIARQLSRDSVLLSQGVSCNIAAGGRKLACFEMPASLYLCGLASLWAFHRRADYRTVILRSRPS